MTFLNAQNRQIPVVNEPVAHDDMVVVAEGNDPSRIQLVPVGQLASSGFSVPGFSKRAGIDYALNGSDVSSDQADIYRKGGQQVFVGWDDAEQFRIVSQPGVVNNLAVEGALTSATPVLFARGSDANIGISLTAKGSGGFFFNNGRSTLLEIGDHGEIPAGFTYWLTIAPGSSSYQAPYISSPDHLDLKAVDTKQVRFYVNDEVVGAFNRSSGPVTMYPVLSGATDYVRFSTAGSAGNRAMFFQSAGNTNFFFWSGAGQLVVFDSNNLGSVVNSINIRATQTGVNPIIRSTGETNTGLRLQPNGTGTVELVAPNVIDRFTVTGVTYNTPTTGFSIVIGNAVTELHLTPAGTLAAGTITMPASPYDGQTVTVSTTQTVTALTVSANAGQTIGGDPTTITATTPFTMRYRATGSVWRRVG